MLEVYVSNIENYDYQKDLDFLPEIRKTKTLNYKNEINRKQCAGVYSLLKKILTNHHLKIEDYEWKLEENGKPYLEGLPFSFNYSHSEAYIVVVLSNAPVGVDIQYKKDIDEVVFNKVVSTEDKNFFKINNKKSLFYKVWSRKEAYYKYLGRGENAFYQDFPAFGISDLSFIDLTIIPGYQMCIVTPLIDKIKIKKLSL